MNTAMNCIVENASHTVPDRRHLDIHQSHQTSNRQARKMNRNRQPHRLVYPVFSSSEQEDRKTNASDLLTLEDSGQSEINKTTRRSNRGENGIHEKIQIIATGPPTNIGKDYVAADRASKSSHSCLSGKTADGYSRVKGDQGCDGDDVASCLDGGEEKNRKCKSYDENDRLCITGCK